MKKEKFDKEFVLNAMIGTDEEGLHRIEKDVQMSKLGQEMKAEMNQAIAETMVDLIGRKKLEKTVVDWFLEIIEF